MAVRTKVFVSDEIYFITFTIFGWQNIFTTDKYCQLVFKWFNHMKTSYGNKLHGYVIMPNHLHLLLYISRTSPKLSTLIQNGKRFLAYGIVDYLKADGKTDLLSYFQKYADKKHNAKHKIFEPRYDSLLIQSDKFFYEKLNYIHNNPCQLKWHLVAQPEDYKYSSASNYIVNSGLYEVEMIR